MNITYWSDYACPYCYIGETQLKQALDKLGLEDTEITMRSFELDPNASREDTGTTVERFSRKYGLTTEEGAKRVQSISDLAKETGIDFNYADTHYTNTFDAHRLTKFAQNIDNDLANELSEKLYEAYFVDKKRLADYDTLIDCAVSSGLDEEKVRSMLSSTDFVDEVKGDEVAAHQLGVNAVPFFVIDDKYAIPGAVGTETMVEILDKINKNEVEM